MSSDRLVVDQFYGGQFTDRRVVETNQQTGYFPAQQAPPPAQIVTRQTTIAATDYYKRLTEELNKCFDDIELFVRYLEALMEYTKELERDHRRKDKKATGSSF